jgi:hypothetical protein
MHIKSKIKSPINTSKHTQANKNLNEKELYPVNQASQNYNVEYGHII